MKSKQKYSLKFKRNFEIAPKEAITQEMHNKLIDQAKKF
jgi:hypothetical protein